MNDLALRRLEQLRRINQIMDEAIAIPGTGIRFGLDSIVGLVPGVGDAVTTLITACGVALAASAGAPPVVLARMLINVGLDALIGTPPVIGDIVDVFFKANRKNLALFERWVESPERTQHTSRLVIAAGVVTVVGVIGGTLWLGLRLLGLLVALGSR